MRYTEPHIFCIFDTVENSCFLGTHTLYLYFFLNACSNKEQATSVIVARAHKFDGQGVGEWKGSEFECDKRVSRRSTGTRTVAEAVSITPASQKKGKKKKKKKRKG